MREPMTTTCPSCYASQPDGVLCWQCTEAVTTMLTVIPQLADELDVAISRQAKVTGGGKAGKGTARERSPINFGALAVRDALLVEFALWHDIDEVRRHPHAGTIVATLGRVVRDAYRCIDRMQDRQYLGKCGYTEDGAVCSAEVWVRPGAHQVRCSQCDTVHDVPARRAQLLEQAADLIVTPREASQYVGEVGGIKVGQQRIRNYIDRGRIARRPTTDGAMRLRLGDLLAVLLDDSEKVSA